jgi:hypothetical protein
MGDLKILFIIIFCITNLYISSSKVIAILKTCPACRLNYLQEIKNFIRDESQYYPLEVVFCTGDPRIVIMDNKGDEIETLEIAYLSKSQVMELLESKGFHRYT